MFLPGNLNGRSLEMVRLVASISGCIFIRLFSENEIKAANSRKICIFIVPSHEGSLRGIPFSLFFRAVLGPPSGPESSESIPRNARWAKIACKAEVVASSKAQTFFATPALSFTSITGAIRF